MTKKAGRFICGNVKKCRDVFGCPHAIPHKELNWCKDKCAMPPKNMKEKPCELTPSRKDSQ